MNGKDRGVVADSWDEHLGDSRHWGDEVLNEFHTPLAEMVLPERGTE